MRASPRRPRRLIVRSEVVRRFAKDRLGVDSARAIAVALGIEPSTMVRLMAGRNQPSGVIIATLLDGLDVRFDDVFAIVADEPEPVAEAA
jgi:hypothetical protein